jgi:hypothetical protein
MLAYTRVAAGDAAGVVAALQGEITDTEDALQVVAAESLGADYIVTRNVRDYARSPIPAVTPVAFLRLVAAARETEANG